MLSELAIKNFAIIDDIRISFSEGLCVLTGETGAGKSIIIEAVNLLLGGRASSDLVRNGEDHAELEAFFLIDPESAPARIMREQELDPSEGLIIRRIIALNGRHKIFINSRQSTMQMLRLVTEDLASISSQHAHQGLLNEENHLDILDTFADTWHWRREVQDIYNELVPMIRELVHLKTNVDKISEENEFLRFQVNEIEQANIQPLEDEILEIEKNRLSNGSQIYEIIHSGINEIYSRDDSILEKLGFIKSDFDKYSKIDSSLEHGSQTIARIMLELEDLTDELRRVSDQIDLDPESLEQTQVRLDQIQKLKRKYSGTGGTLDDLFRRYQALKSKISSTENIAEEIERMEKHSALLSARLGQKALKLSEKRKKAATRLAQLAENELKSLEMENTRFEIAINRTKADNTKSDSINKDTSFGNKSSELTTDTEGYKLKTENLPDETMSHLLSVNGIKIYATGIDRVSFLMAPNPGEPPKPLNRIASGGELSRVVLALKAVVSGTKSQGTLIFDEVDSGIGGRTSDKVGIKLQQLSEKYQVLCITHLAQIAKYGSTHYKIEKQVINKRTSTSITPLLEIDKRVKELARMMGGTNISEATLAHAAEMIKFTTDAV